MWLGFIAPKSQEPNEKMRQEDGSCTGTGQEDRLRWEPAQAGTGSPRGWVMGRDGWDPHPSPPTAVSSATENKNANGEQELVW